MPYVYNTIESKRASYAGELKSKATKSRQNIRFYLKFKESENKHVSGVNCYVFMH